VTRGDAVQVIDINSGKLLTTISGLHGTHGIAVTGRTGFITNGKDNSVTAFDLDSNQTLTPVASTGEGPDAILYEPKLKRIYTMNHKGGDITAINPSTRKVVGTIRALPELESAVTDGKGKIFANSEAENKVAVIDARTSKMVAAWELGGCTGPTGLAIDIAHHRLFSTCANNEMVIVDSKSGKVLAELPIGAHSDAAAFDPALGIAYSSNGDGTLTAVHEDDPDHFRVVANIATQEGARTMALDPATHKIYLAAASYGPAPAATADMPKPRKPILPGSFRIIVITPRLPS
jgi:DNA-binding beta-propeller fold protein YncE